MKRFFAYFVTAASVMIPAVASAAGPNLDSLVGKLIGYANQALVLMMAIAVVLFVFYIIKYFIKADADRTEGNKYVMWSVIGFFIILSFWGLVNILQNSFGLQNDTNRPSAWTSFTNIFPGGGGSTSGNNFSNPVSPTPSRNFSNPVAPSNNVYQSYESGITPDSYHQ